MYAETGLMFPYFHHHHHHHQQQQFDDFSCTSHKLNASSLGLIQTSTISDYNLGDLFKAPEPVLCEPPLMGIDPVTAAISMISCGEDVVISPQLLTVSDIESSMESGQLLSDMFYECKKDLLAKEENEMPLTEAISVVVQLPMDEKVVVDEKLIINGEGPFQKSVSSSCLRSMDGVRGTPLLCPSFPEFPVLDFGSAYGMRRAFSDGDIKALGNGDVNLIQSPVGQPKILSICTSEDRREKLSRYRSKKSKRNFGRKIKYACRKALADSQPRIRGRFAKTE